MTSPNQSATTHANVPTDLSVQSLGSGSSGNAFLIRTAETSLLLDCGVGIRILTRTLRECGLQLHDLGAVLVTHEHSDHIRSLSCVIGKDVPIVSTAGTRRRANIPPPQWEQIGPNVPLAIGAITVWAMMVSHDAAEPCGYVIETAGTRVAIFTDLGSWHERLADPVRASDLVVLESNHDQDMLWRGPYPAHLKRRVASPVGHLSNADCASALAAALRGKANGPEVWLAHLSATNNDPATARRETELALGGEGLQLNVTPLPRLSAGPVWRPAGDRVPAAWTPARPPVPVSQLSIDALL